jgi:hypothetical protein
MKSDVLMLDRRLFPNPSNAHNTIPISPPASAAVQSLTWKPHSSPPTPHLLKTHQAVRSLPNSRTPSHLRRRTKQQGQGGGGVEYRVLAEEAEFQPGEARREEEEEVELREVLQAGGEVRGHRIQLFTQKNMKEFYGHMHHT